MYRKNTAGQYIYFCLVNATTGGALTGATVTAYRALDSGAQSAATGTTTELANGQYRFNLSQADTNAENGSYLFVATSAVPVEKTVVFTSANPSDSTAFGLSRVDAAISSRMATYTQPTGFLAATFPATVSSYAGGAVASVTAGVTVTTNNDKTGYSLTAGTGLGNQTANITGNLSGSVGSVTGAVGSVTSGVTVTTNNDKTGYSLSSGGLAAVTTWTVGITGNITGNLSGSVGSVTGAVTLDSAAIFAVADQVWDEATSGHTTAGTYGGRIVRATNSNTEVQITGANHIAADVHEFQTGVITAADFAADAITASALATDAVTEIQSGLATSAALAAAKTILDKVDTGLVVDGAVYQFTANMLELGPSGGGGSSVNVLPATGIVADRSAGTTLNPVVGETISQSITVYQSDGTTAVNLSNKTLKVIFETMSGVDVAVVAAADITISGTSSNVVTFAYPSAVTASERTLRFAIRDAAAPLTMYLQGVCSVVAAPKVDA